MISISKLVVSHQDYTAAASVRIELNYNETDLIVFISREINNEGYGAPFVA